MINHITANLQEAKTCLDALMNNDKVLKAIADAATLLIATFKSEGQVISCGNGGSHCDAMHFAEEFTGRFRKNRKPLAAVAVSDPSHITCTANDFGYEEIFARFVWAHGRRGDVLFAISTSGTSKNILKAAVRAKESGMKVIALTGKQNCELAEYADVHVFTEGGRYADRVQEMHIKVIHILIELVERQLCPENYA